MPVNQGDVNTEAKLLMHRIPARRLRRGSTILERARARFASLEEQLPSYVLEWQEILALGPAAVARAITERGARMERLRNASPFDLPKLTDLAPRRRVWSKARRRLAAGLDRPCWEQVR